MSNTELPGEVVEVIIPAQLSASARLAALLPKEGRQEALGRNTGKKYDMDGFGYQYVADRFNEVLGVDGWWFDYEVVHEDTGSWGKSGKTWVELTVKVTISLMPGLDATHVATRVCAGGHKSDSYPDALKGAITNGFKKCAAFFGPGRSAYAGSIDDDYRAAEGADDSNSNRARQLPSVTATENPALKAVGDSFRQLKALGVDWKTLFDPPIDPTKMNEADLASVLSIAKARVQQALDAAAPRMGAEEPPTPDPDPDPVGPGNLADGFRNDSGVKF